jgi:large-conductance mechanosensitive channel
MLKEFRDLLMRGNLVDLAVALVMGSRSPRSSARS